MNIKPYQQQTRPSSFRKPVSTVKAEGKLAEAKKYQQKAGDIAFFGGLVTNMIPVADKILDVKSATDLMKAETTVDKRKNDFLLRLNDPENRVPYDEWESLTNEELQNIKIDAMEGLTLRRSKKEFERRYERWSNGFKNEIAIELLRQQELEAEADFIKSVEYQTAEGDFAKVREYVAGARGWLVTPAEADQMEKEAESQIAYNIASAGVDSFADIEQGMKYLHSEELNKVLEAKGINPGALTAGTRKKMEKTKREDWRFKQALETERFQNANMAQMEDAQRMAHTGEVTVEMLDSGEIDRMFPDITAPNKRTLRAIIDNKTKEIETGVPQKTDPGFEVELGLMFADTEGVSNWELNQWVIERLEPDEEGKFISYDDYQSFLTDLRIRRPEPSVINGLRMFDESRQRGDITFEQEAQLQNMLRSERLKKDYSPNEILDIAKNLLLWMEEPGKLKKIQRDIDKAVEGKPRKIKKVEEMEEKGELLGIEQTGVELSKEEEVEPEEEKPDIEKMFIKTFGRKPTKTQVFKDVDTGTEYTVFTDKKGYWRYWNGKWQKYNKRKEEWQDKKLIL